jgi:hypothetical protein
VSAASNEDFDLRGEADGHIHGRLTGPGQTGRAGIAAACFEERVRCSAQEKVGMRWQAPVILIEDNPEVRDVEREEVGLQAVVAVKGRRRDAVWVA